MFMALTIGRKTSLLTLNTGKTSFVANNTGIFMVLCTYGTILSKTFVIPFIESGSTNNDILDCRLLTDLTLVISKNIYNTK